MTIVGVIVAAGESARMGRPKQLLTIGDRPLLQWVVDAAEESTLDQIVVVTGHAAEEVRAAVTLERAIWAHNPEPGRGTMSSLRVGVAAANDPGAVMKLVCDQPEVRRQTIDRLLASWDPAAYQTALVTYANGDGHPMLLSAAVLTPAMEQDGDRLLWDLLAQHADDVQRVAVEGPRPIDINNVEDLRVAAARLGYSSPA